MLSFKKYLLSEVSQRAWGQLKAVIDAFEEGKEDQPFDDIFANKSRVVVPLPSSNRFLELENRLKLMKDKNGPMFDPKEPVDWKGKSANRVQVSQKGTRTQKIRIGKILNKIATDPEEAKIWKNWWSRYSNLKPEMLEDLIAQEKGQGKQMSVIISRHPGDVLRMSDYFPSSCHAEKGGGYFQCAVDEATDAGLVSYLVSTDDLEGVDLQAAEIFEDKDRKQPKGKYITKQISRLRLRRYSKGENDDQYVEKEQVNLAIPEDRIYGSQIDKYRDAVLDWARSSQEKTIDALGGKDEIDLHDFVLNGGSYRDTSDGQLWNYFFKTDKFHGDTEHRNSVNQAEIWRAEIEQIHNEYNGAYDWKTKKSTSGSFKHSSTDYEEAEEEGQIYFYWSGSIGVAFDEKIFIETPEDSDLKGRHDDKDTLEYALGEKYFYGQEEMSVNNYGGKVSIGMWLRDEENGLGNPDEYRNFCEWVDSEWDSKYDVLIPLKKAWDQQQDWLPGIPKPTRNPYETHKDKLKISVKTSPYGPVHFEVDWAFELKDKHKSVFNAIRTARIIDQQWQQIIQKAKVAFEAMKKVVTGSPDTYPGPDPKFQ